MIAFVRFVSIMPGKTPDALATAHKIKKHAKEKHGSEINLMMPIGGNPNRIAFVSRADHLAEVEAALEEIAAEIASFRKYQQDASHQHAPNDQTDDIRNTQQVFDLIGQLLLVQFRVSWKEPREFFSTLIANKLAAGYVFGFHDCCLQIYGLIDQNYSAAGMAVIRRSYKNIFGDRSGAVLFQSSTVWQEDREFIVGRQSGGEDFAEFKKNGTPTLGLQRIIALGFNVSMVERTLNHQP